MGRMCENKVLAVIKSCVNLASLLLGASPLSLVCLDSSVSLSLVLHDPVHSHRVRLQSQSSGNREVHDSLLSPCLVLPPAPDCKADC